MPKQKLLKKPADVIISTLLPKSDANIETFPKIQKIQQEKLYYICIPPAFVKIVGLFGEHLARMQQ